MAVPLRPSTRDADTRGLTCCAVTNENVLDPIRVIAHKVGGIRSKRDIPSVGTDNRAGTEGRSLHATIPDADSFDIAGQPVNTNTSNWPFVSPATRLDALDWNATKRPSMLRLGPVLVPFP